MGYNILFDGLAFSDLNYFPFFFENVAEVNSDNKIRACPLISYSMVLHLSFIFQESQSVESSPMKQSTTRL